RLHEAAAELDTLTRQQAETRSRLNVLEQLDSSHEGFSSGVLAALHRQDGVLGSLADRIRVPDGRYITAVEAALGHHLQLVLSETSDTARAILADLAASKKGRASIAPVAWQQNGSSHAQPHPSSEAESPSTSDSTPATSEAAAPSGNGNGSVHANGDV